MKIDYDTFKYSLTNLEKLEEFKSPFTKFYQQFVFKYSSIDFTYEDNPEFYILDFAEKEGEIENYTEKIKNIDEEIKIVSMKLTKLLTIKEQQLKQNLEEWKQRERISN